MRHVCRVEMAGISWRMLSDCREGTNTQIPKEGVALSVIPWVLVPGYFLPYPRISVLTFRAELGKLPPFRLPLTMFMKPLHAISLVAVMSLFLSLSVSGGVLLDDDWDDGDRTDTNLPEESAWYGSTAFSTNTLTAFAGGLRANVLMVDANNTTNASSRLWITHFTPNGSPATLAVGDTLKASLAFTVSNLATPAPTSRGFRIGLFNFSEPGAARATADGISTGAGAGAPGTNVTGYMLNMNFAESLVNNPMQLMKRTDLATNNLMGALAVFSSFGTGGGAPEHGFRNGELYKFEFIVKRLETAVEITTRFSDTNGWTVSHTVTDPNNPYLSFDGFAIRPNAVADTAQAFTFTEFKVEQLPFEVRITSWQLLPPFNDVSISFPTLRGKTYQALSRASLTSGGDWDPVGDVVTGDGQVATVVDTNTGFDERYYRVLQQP